MVASSGHLHFDVTTTIDNSLVLDSLGQDTEGIMQTSFGFFKNVGGSTSQDNGTGTIGFATRETDELVFSDHNFLNQVTVTKDFFSSFGIVEGGDDFSTGSGSESLNTIEISVFNDNNTLSNV